MFFVVEFCTCVPRCYSTKSTFLQEIASRELCANTAWEEQNDFYFIFLAVPSEQGRNLPSQHSVLVSQQGSGGLRAGCVSEQEMDAELKPRLATNHRCPTCPVCSPK